MTKLYFIIFNEDARGIIKGINRKYSFLEMPVWGGIRIRDAFDFPFKLLGLEDYTFVDYKNIGNLLDDLIKGEERELFVLRSSNIVWPDYKELIKTVGKGKYRGEIIKFNVNNTPADFYHVPREDLISILQKVIKNNDGIISVFNDFLFNGFQKISYLNGYNFLMRNSYEFYHENLMFIHRINNRRFTLILNSIPYPQITEAHICDGAAVVSSYVGSGSKISGEVKHSVIFYDVEIGRDAKIINSVIMPGNIIEDGAIIENTLMLGSRQRVIGSGSVIGVIKKDTADFSGTNSKICTLIGEDIGIPRGSRIGFGCEVYGRGVPANPIVLDDGEKLVFDLD